MIETRDFQALMQDAGSAYPPRGDALEEQWWARHGVDLASLVDWCASEAADDVENTIPIAARDAGLPPDVAVGAGIAMAYHMGFLFGWLLCEQERGR